MYIVLKCFALFSPSMLSNPKFSCHLGNFLCFQRNPIRILLTGKSNKNSIYTRRQRSEVMKWKLACFKRAHFERRACHKRARESFAKWTFQQYGPWEGNFSHYYQIWYPFSKLGFLWSQAGIFARRSCLLFFSLRGGTTSLLDFCKRKPMLWDG